MEQAEKSKIPNSSFSQGNNPALGQTLMEPQGEASPQRGITSEACQGLSSAETKG